ncbi:Phytochrome A-associated F-box protein, putative [Ricinus communis]|uniref:Phytochrome A-associated F-box protein, putative n=1 Tax=Ricinus communis TaxID=3988 RepID=B9SAQ8_RICCO|nr:Phytochrome A-associated F-box protein, putative [Ricinus communis]|eukprot:XP_025013840.1 phytochrome A-associated F-box protein [Ricinus communis]
MVDSSIFSKLADDIVLTIFFKLEDDPRNWARLACVCTKFTSLIRNICFKAKCHRTIPSVVSDLLASSDGAIPGGWSSLHKLSVCCPGLLHAGFLLEHSDFGLERELGPDDNYHKTSVSRTTSSQPPPPPPPGPSSDCSNTNNNTQNNDCSWSLFDDLYYDTIYDVSESEDVNGSADVVSINRDDKTVLKGGGVCKRRKISRSLRSHLASGVWNLSREQGNKLLASRFRGDSLYICDWPGCVHMEEKRNYMLFRGIFKNFKRSRVWRTINDGNRRKIDLNCAFCGCKETWDLHSAFCLRRVFGYHDDGEPIVRAYVCENGHVSGAWTDVPLYT